MIKKLQRKMVIIMMISVCLVLSAIMIAINVVNYSRIAKDADEIINIIGSNSGRFPKPDMFKPMGNNEFRDRDKHLNDFNINVETPYETRYFTVKLSDDNSVEYVDTGNVAAIDSSKAIEYANTVLDSNKTKGYLADDFKPFHFLQRGKPKSRDTNRTETERSQDQTGNQICGYRRQF